MILRELKTKRDYLLERITIDDIQDIIADTMELLDELNERTLKESQGRMRK